MKMRRFLNRAAFLAISGAALYVVSIVQGNIHQVIEKSHLRDTGQVENAPPMVAFTTVALGAFRGLAGNFLWMRAKALQEEGKYMEILQISKLDSTVAAEVCRSSRLSGLEYGL